MGHKGSCFDSSHRVFGLFSSKSFIVFGLTFRCFEFKFGYGVKKCSVSFFYMWPVKSESRSAVSDSLRAHRLYSPWNSQARILEWVAFPFSRGSSQLRDWTQVSHIAGRFFTSWGTREAQEYWSGLPIPSPGDLPDPGIKLGSPALQVDSLSTELLRKPFSSFWNLKSFLLFNFLE